jgi:hypothetical protein
VSRELPRFLGMTYQQATWVLIGLQLLAVEAFAGFRGDPLLTDAIREGSSRWLLWPALYGTLGGHFFGERGGPAWGPWALLALGLVILYRDLFVKTEVSVVTQFAMLLIFQGLGAWLWGSR